MCYVTYMEKKFNGFSFVIAKFWHRRRYLNACGKNFYTVICG
jgi:hypothetical protein